jgi:hypothetical protein
MKRRALTGTGHQRACADSRALCDLLVGGLRKRIPKLQSHETKSWCALFEPGRSRFAYVAHRTASAAIEVWCTGDLEDLTAHKGAKVVPRPNIRKGWNKRFPGRFQVTSPTGIEGACDLLHDVSYQAS